MQAGDWDFAPRIRAGKGGESVALRLNSIVSPSDRGYASGRHRQKYETSETHRGTSSYAEWDCVSRKGTWEMGTWKGWIWEASVAARSTRIRLQQPGFREARSSRSKPKALTTSRGSSSRALADRASPSTPPKRQRRVDNFPSWHQIPAAIRVEKVWIHSEAELRAASRPNSEGTAKKRPGDLAGKGGETHCLAWVRH